MPRAFDSQPLPFDRDPLRNILGGIPKQPPVDFAALQQAGVNWFNMMMSQLFDTAAWDDAQAKWNQVINQIGALFALVQSPVSPAQWAVWWSNTLTLLGIDSQTAATVANWLSGNYDAAKQAKKWWDDFLASWGIGTPADVAAATALNIARNKRKAQNDAIIADWLHVKYPLGSITDTAATLVGGKRTWWGAVNDNLLLVAQIFGLAQETPDPSADVGTAAAVAQATANTGVANAGAASTAAGNALSTATAAGNKADQNRVWATRKQQNDRILGDWLHATYPIGSVSDTAATLVGGKRTYWGAWNDNLLIVAEQLGISPPSDPLVDIGTQTALTTATANTAASNASLATAANQDLTNKIIASQTGVEPTTGTSSDAYNALTNIPASNIQGQLGATVTWGATSGIVTNSGGFSTTLSTNLSFTPAATDTMVDVVVTFYHAQESNHSVSVLFGGVAQTQIIRQGNTFSGNLVEVAVFRVPITATQNPTQKTFTINLTSTAGNTTMSAVAVSYSAVKVSYSAATFGPLATDGNGYQINMYRQSDPSKRLVMVATGLCSGTVLNAVTASGATVRANAGAAGNPVKIFVQDQAAIAGNNAVACKLTNQNNTTGAYVAVLLELSN